LPVDAALLTQQLLLLCRYDDGEVRALHSCHLSREEF
jgi:hypothetical protein